MLHIDGLLQDIRERDARDAGRAAAPLKPAADAVILDTTDMTIDRPRSSSCSGATGHARQRAQVRRAPACRRMQEARRRRDKPAFRADFDNQPAVARHRVLVIGG